MFVSVENYSVLSKLEIIALSNERVNIDTLRVVVIGAGPAGCSCAYELAKRGITVSIYESGIQPGGMSKSIELWGQKVDLGPHRFFSKDERVNSFFREIVQEDYSMVRRLTRIFYRNRFIQYPLKPFNAIRNLPIGTVFRVLWDYFMVKIRPVKDQTTFEGWVTQRFGKRLFSLFFKSYSEKLWGLPCDQIDADWASQRIKSLNLFEAMKAGLKGNRGAKHATLLEEFAYPNEGTGQIYEKCIEEIKLAGGNVHLNTKVKRVLTNDLNQVSGIELMNGELVEADAVVSTMPLNLLLKGLTDVPELVEKATDSLVFRNTILVYLEVDSSELFEDNWLYIHSNRVKHGRVTNFRNWGETLNNGKKSSILCLEFWAFDHDDIWSWEDEQLIELAKEEVRAIELIPAEVNVPNGYVLKISRSYPVYQKGYRVHMEVIEKYLNQFENLLPIGRYGAFKYNNQDHSILMGILAAEKLAENKSINLWDINTDSTYQEEEEVSELIQKT